MAKISEIRELRDRNHVFDDRLHAGEILAKELERYVNEDLIILAIPSGGVPVAGRIVEELQAPMDVIIVRKLHIPYNPEAGFGSISWDGDVMLNKPLVRELGLTKEEIKVCIEKERQDILRRVEKFRGERPFPDLKGRVVVIVDDGLASGYTMLSSIKAVKKYSPRKVIVAVPTGSPSAIDLISPSADEIICLNIRGGFFFAVADVYKEWHDVTYEEVMDVLEGLEK